jgi:aldose 1-epimerase
VIETISLAAGRLGARVSARGGAIVDAVFDGVPILRPYTGDEAATFDPLKAGSFPLVPFGNRVEGNTFTFDGVTRRFAPNTDWDRHYLHGDAWLMPWQVVERRADAVTFAVTHLAAPGAPYAYAARETIALAGEVLAVRLAVENTGDAALPFGLGHHPFFPLTAETRLTAPATGFWTEKQEFLPDRLSAVPAELDFSTARRLPGHWLNNGFEGWSGRARIDWPERDLSLRIEADPLFSRYFLFRSDNDFEPGFRGDYFCFEPMTHSADGPHLDGLGGLRRLAPGETLEAGFRFVPLPLDSAP